MMHNELQYQAANFQGSGRSCHLSTAAALPWSWEPRLQSAQATALKTALTLLAKPTRMLLTSTKPLKSNHLLGPQYIASMVNGNMSSKLSIPKPHYISFCITRTRVHAFCSLQSGYLTFAVKLILIHCLHAWLFLTCLWSILQDPKRLATLLIATLCYIY